MKNEFGDMPNARVVLQNVSQKEVLDYKARLEATDGVLSVTWLDSVIPASLPPDILPEGISEIFWKDGNAPKESILMGSTIGTHVGPGAYAVAYFCKK